MLRDCFAFAMSLVGRTADAEDLVQETYLKAQRAFAEFQPGTNVKAWLFTILRRVQIDRHRRTKLRPVARPDEELDALAVAAGPPEETEIDGLTPQDVREALEEVPEVFRMPVRLRDVDGLSYAEIGRILDVPPGTIMSRLHRGRESLRGILVRRKEARWTASRGARAPRNAPSAGETPPPPASRTTPGSRPTHPPRDLPPGGGPDGP